MMVCQYYNVLVPEQTLIGEKLHRFDIVRIKTVRQDGKSYRKDGTNRYTL